MPKHNRTLLTVLLVAAAILFSVLTDRRQEVSIGEQIVVTAIGIDKAENGIKLSVQAVDSLKTSANLSEQSQTATGVYRATAPSVSQALEEFLNESGRNTYILHNKLIAISDEVLTDRSLYEVLDFFLRSGECSGLVDVVICRGDAESLLTIESANDAIEAEYVAQMLKEGRRWGRVVPSHLLSVQQTASGDYDAAVPILRVDNGVPRLDGTCLFRKGYAVEELNAEETVALSYAADTLDTCLHSVDGVTLQTSSLSSHISFLKDDTCRITVKGTVEIRESEKRLTQTQKERYIGRFEQQLTDQIIATITAIGQRYTVDPLALNRRAALCGKVFLPKNGHISVTVDMRLKESELWQ